MHSKRKMKNLEKGKSVKYGCASNVRRLDGPIDTFANIEKKRKLNRLMLFESLCTVCISMFPLFV